MTPLRRAGQDGMGGPVVPGAVREGGNNPPDRPNTSVEEPP